LSSSLGQKAQVKNPTAMLQRNADEKSYDPVLGVLKMRLREKVDDWF
jgi:hypothetical protein